MKEKIQKIKMLLMDVDGVMTDGGIILGSNGMEMKIFNVQDGTGVTMARMAGLRVGIITGRESEAVSRRAMELKVDELYQGYRNKLEPYMKIKDKYDLTDAEIAFIGDDVLDLPLLGKVGFSVAVVNAREEVKENVDYITHTPGGRGAVREVTDLILKAQGKWHTIWERL